MADGGSIRGVSIAGRSYVVDAEADGNISMSKYKTEGKPNGDGSARNIATAKLQYIKGLKLSIGNKVDDYNFLVQIVNKRNPFNVTVTTATDHTYAGYGIINSDLELATMDGVVEVDIEILNGKLDIIS